MARHKCGYCGHNYYGHKRKACRKCIPRYDTKTHQQKFKEKVKKQKAEIINEHLTNFINAVSEKTCYHCEKYPCCTQYKEISNSIERNCIIKSQSNILISVAVNCNYYKEKKE